jgi:hypothetical protein
MRIGRTGENGHFHFHPAKGIPAGVKWLNIPDRRAPLGEMRSAIWSPSMNWAGSTGLHNQRCDGETF